jgi:predicted outer membrane repeat protein
MPVWSESNPDLLVFIEVHVSTGNVVKSYDVFSETIATVYDSNLDPSVVDCGNEDFLGAGSGIVFGDYTGSGESDVYEFHGTYNATKITTDNDAPTDRVDVSSNYSGTRTIYYSGSALYSPGCDIGGIVFSDFVAGLWWENPAGFGDPSFVGEIPGYWAAYSGHPDDKILASMMTDCWSGNSLGLYDATGDLVSNLLGAPATDWKWCFGWQNWEGAAGEILFRAEEYAHTGYGNNLFIVMARPLQVWVDDDWDGPSNSGGHAWGYNAFDNIAEAIDIVLDGGTVNVAAGLYAEQIIINKPLVLQGTGDPVIQPPADPLRKFRVPESTARFEPIVLAYGGTDDGAGNISGSATIQVSISGFDIDGNNRGSVDRFAGIMVRNCASSVISYNDIYEMLYSSGQPQTLGIMAYGNSSVDIHHNAVNDWTRGGIVANGDDGALPDPVVTVGQNTVVGEGPLPIGSWAQNGIQIGYGAYGSVTGNEISDIFCLDPNWSASGLIILYPGGAVSLIGNNVHDVQGALNAYFADGLTLSGNIFEDNDFAFIWGGNIIEVAGNTFDGHVVGTTNAGLYLADVTNAILGGNTFAGNQYGIVADGACVNLTFTSNVISTNAVVGALVSPYGPSPMGVVFHGNSFSGNTFGLDNTTAIMIDATSNWWGDGTGPNGPPLGSGGAAPPRPLLTSAFDGDLRQPELDRSLAPTARASDLGRAEGILLGNGDPVSSLVDYSPWWGSNYLGDPHASSWQWCVNTSNGSTILEGLNKASAGDIVHIFPGAYHESIAIDKSITIRGDRGDTTVAGPGPEAPILDGTGYTGIGALSVNQGIGNVIIEGLEIRNYGPNGSTGANAVSSWNSGTSSVMVRDNHLHHLGYAGVLTGNGWGGPQGLHDGWVISRNVIDNFGAYAVDLENARNSQIFGNEVSSPTFAYLQGIMVVALADAGHTIECTNIAITANVFSSYPDRVINVVAWAQDITSAASIRGIDISDNTITCNFTAINDWKLGSGTNIIGDLTIGGNEIVVNNPKASGYTIDISDVTSTVALTGNSVIHTGALQPGATFFHGLNIGGANIQTVALSDNGLVGGNLGASDVGIRIRSTLPATANLVINDCDISGFAQGVRADALPAGCTVALNHCGIHDNSASGLTNGSGASIAAAGNWWGSYCGPYNASTNPNGQGNAISDNASYDPWCESTYARCDFSNGAAPSVVWVDDDYTVDGLNDSHYWCYDAFDNIQDGIDKVADGGTVNVLAGNYIGQIAINKSVNLAGTGRPIIQCPTPPLVSYIIAENTARFEPVVFAYGGTNDGSGNISGPGTIQLTISGFDIDGNNAGNTNRFTAFLFRNCQASSMSNNSIYEMLYSSGMPMTFGVLIYGNSNVLVDNNTVADFTRNGITANGDNGGLPDPQAMISNNRVIGEGILPQGNWAQNGIQIGYGAGGSVIGNEIYDIAILDPSWAASAMVIYDAANGIVLRRNNIHDCQAALNAYYTDSLFVDSCAFAGNDYAFVLDADNIGVTNCDFDSNSQALFFADVTNTAILYNRFSGNEYAVIIDGACSDYLIADNVISASTEAGVYVQPSTGTPTDITLDANCIFANAFAVMNLTTNMIQATGNWWGDALGPIVSTTESRGPDVIRPVKIAALDQSLDRPAADAVPASAREVDRVSGVPGDDTPHPLLTGDQVSTYVDYSPWWSADYLGDPHVSNWKWCLDNSNSSSIQEAIDIVTSGDSIHAMPCTYSGTGNRGIDFGGKNIVLCGADGAERTIIDCQSAGRAFHFHSGETISSLITGFTIKNGYVPGNGGAVLCENASAPEFKFCLFINNRAAGDGGAFYFHESSARLVNNTILWNSAGGMAGGVCMDASDATLLNVLLWQDTASADREISVDGGAPSITFCDIDGGYPGEGNVRCNPRFCEPDTGNFYVSDISCCANGGIGGTHIGAFGLGCTGDFLPGDANADNVVNGLDVVYLVNYFKDIGPPIPPPIWRADVNGNCIVNGLDVVFLVNYLKGFGPPPRDGDCVGTASYPGTGPDTEGRVGGGVK